MVLPCPGSNAWSAPRPAAIKAAENNTQKLNFPCVEISSVKRLRGVFCAWAASDSEAPVGATTPGDDCAALGTDAVIRLEVIASADRRCLSDTSARCNRFVPGGTVPVTVTEALLPSSETEVWKPTRADTCCGGLFNASLE